MKEKVIEEFIEKGANLEHERWAKWQEYFFSKCQIKPQLQLGGMDDRYVYFALSKDLYERWNRQIITKYPELSEREKESDRIEVRKYLPLISSTYDTAYERGVRDANDDLKELKLGYTRGYKQCIKDVMEKVDTWKKEISKEIDSSAINVSYVLDDLHLALSKLLKKNNGTNN